MADPTPVKRPRHLMDPNNPRPTARSDGMSLSSVQKWVMSTLAVTTILHMSLGLVLAALTVDDTRHEAKVGLVVIAAIFGIFSVVVGLAIHKARLVTPWVLLGAIPALIGAYFVL